MIWIIIGVLGLAALLLVFSLIKKLVKLALTVVVLALVVLGIWYVSQQNPEVSESMRQVGTEAAEKLKEAAADAVDEASLVVRERAGKAADQASEVVEEKVGEALDEATTTVRDTVGESEESTPETDEAASQRDSQP